MVEVDIIFGWGMVVTGSLLLLVEAYSPGFFIAVPATVMIILGILLLLGVEIFTTVWGVVIGVGVALAAAIFTVWLYGRLTPDESPTTISRDSLVGREGQVMKEVDPDTLSGKVLVTGIIFSARTKEGVIPAGRRVRVLRSEGVHVIVEEVT
jgi:inner membrane protein